MSSNNKDVFNVIKTGPHFSIQFSKNHQTFIESILIEPVDDNTDFIISLYIFLGVYQIKITYILDEYNPS